MFKPLFTKIAASNRVGIFFVILLLLAQSTKAQPPIPKFEPLQPINVNGSVSTSPGPLFSQTNPLLQDDRYTAQNQKILQQAGMLPGPSLIGEKHAKEVELAQQELRTTNLGGAWMKDFQDNFNQFLQLDPDHFSICKAVYLSESAYYDHSNRPAWTQFEASIEQGARLVRQILKRERLSDKNGTAVNYAIQKLYAQNNEYYDSATQIQHIVPKLRYDFEDYMGDRDWTKMFVMKLLHTGTGQCHSMPLAYLCLAEQLHAKAYLSLAPNHSFVQYFDSKGQRYNFEATNGNLVTQIWLMQSTYINATALKNGTYLDTLSSRKLYAQCLGDLLSSYLMKTRRYDDFSEQIIRKILEVDPQNMIALMETANRDHAVFQQTLAASGNPRPEEYSKFPTLYAAYLKLRASEQRIAATGFQEMPKEAYQQWLKSLELEKRQEENRREQERMKQEIERLKKLNSIVIPDKND
jgi:hypothetical protein